MSITVHEIKMFDIKQGQQSLSSFAKLHFLTVAKYNTNKTSLQLEKLFERLFLQLQLTLLFGDLL